MADELQVACPVCQARFFISISALSSAPRGQTTYVVCPACKCYNSVTSCSMARDRQRHPARKPRPPVEKAHSAKAIGK